MIRYIDIQDKEQLKEARFELLNEEDLKILARPKIIRVVIYARYSSDMQREESIDAQIRYCKEEIARNPNMVLVGVYYDEALSAKDNIEKRDDFQLMIKDGMKFDKYDVILVHKFNRFARNKFDSAVYKKKLRDIGIKVISATQKIDDSPEGRMMESVIEAMDEYYSENLGLEVKKGLRENAYSGRHTGGPAPLGYYVDNDGKYREDKKTSYIIRTIFDMYLQGYGMQAIALELNGKGYRTPRGNMFSTKAISAIIQNEKYTGTFIGDVANEHFRIENNHDALIDKMTFQKAVDIRKKQSHKPRVKGLHLYSLTGKMTCAICGAGYCGSGRKGKKAVGGKKENIYYICPNKKFGKCTNTSVNKGKIEKLICNYILENLLTDEAIDRIVTEFEQVLKEYKDSIPTEGLDDLKAEMNKLKVQEGKLLDLYLDPESPIDKDTLNERVKKTKARIMALDKEIKSHYVTENFQMGKEDAMEYLYQLKDNFDMEDKFSVKAFIDTFVEKVIVKQHDIEIMYKVDFNQKMFEALGDDDTQGFVNVTQKADGGDYGDIVTNSSRLFIISPQVFKMSISKKTLKYMQF